MATKKETYSEAMKRLEAIVAQIESNELDIDELAGRLQEAQRLIKYCREKLYKADAEIKRCLMKEAKKKKVRIKLDFVNITLTFVALFITKCNI